MSSFGVMLPSDLCQLRWCTFISSVPESSFLLSSVGPGSTFICVYVYHFQAIRSVLDLRNRGDVIRLEWLGNNEREEIGRDENKVNNREKKEERMRRWRGWQVSTQQAFVQRIFESTKTL